MTWFDEHRIWGRTKRLHPPELPWTPDHGERPRVLLECPPERSPSIVSTVLERDGFDVVVCEGPTDHRRCPMAEGGYCHTMQGVDVVLNMLDDRSPNQAEVLPAEIAAGPAAPAIVALSDDVGTLAPGVHVISPRSKRPQIVAALRRAMSERGLPGPWWGDGV